MWKTKPKFIFVLALLLLLPFSSICRAATAPETIADLQELKTLLITLEQNNEQQAIKSTALTQQLTQAKKQIIILDQQLKTASEQQEILTQQLAALKTQATIAQQLSQTTEKSLLDVNKSLTIYNAEMKAKQAQANKEKKAWQLVAIIATAVAIAT